MTLKYTSDKKVILNVTKGSLYANVSHYTLNNLWIFSIVVAYVFSSYFTFNEDYFKKFHVKLQNRWSQKLYFELYFYFSAKLDGVKTYMRMRRVPNNIQNKVIKWFDYLWLTQKSSDEEKAVSCLPGNNIVPELTYNILCWLKPFIASDIASIKNVTLTVCYLSLDHNNALI